MRRRFFKLKNNSWNIIWYKTTDNNIIDVPAAPFNNTLISNTYDDIGKLEFIFPVKIIDEGAFTEQYTLQSIWIPESITTLSGNCFRHCLNLENVHINNLSSWCNIDIKFYESTPLNCGAKLYLNGSELADITIPSDITEIKANVFYGCTSLTSVTIPDSVTAIGESAFQNCISLKSITIPNSVTSIGTGAFSDCTSLTSITIPDSVTSFGHRVFYGCTGELIINCNIPSSTCIDSKFSKVTIGDSVTSIGKWAFFDCTSLKEVYCKPTTPPIGNSEMFYQYSSGYKPIECTIYVPTASVDAYKSAQYWSGYAIVGYDFGDDGDSSELITFTVGGTEYQAEEGMTWEEFINSEYNDGNFTISSGYVKYNGYNIYCPRVTGSSMYTLTLSTLAENDSYIIYRGAGGAD